MVKKWQNINNRFWYVYLDKIYANIIACYYTDLPTYHKLEEQIVRISGDNLRVTTGC